MEKTDTRFPKPDNNPWSTLALVTGENPSRLQDLIAVLHALSDLPGPSLDDPRIARLLTEELNRIVPGTREVDAQTLLAFMVAHGEPDQYGGGVVGGCTGLTDTKEPSDSAYAKAGSINEKLRL